MESEWRWNVWFWQLGIGNVELCARILDQPNRWLCATLNFGRRYWYFTRTPPFLGMLQPDAPAPVSDLLPFPAGFNVEPDHVPM